MTTSSNHSAPPSIQRAIREVTWIAEVGWLYFAGIVESPIELLLMERIWASEIGRGVDGLSVLGREYVHGEDRYLSAHGIICYPQAKVGRFRADFLFDVLLPGRDRAFYVVECDGHNFHDRTREQAIHDRQRDRFMVARGVKVLRYTGREINHCAETVWTEIVEIITDGRGPKWSHPHSFGSIVGRAA